MDETPIAHTIESAAKRSTVGRSTIYNEIKSGRLRAVKVGRRTVILESDLRRWLEDLAA